MMFTTGPRPPRRPRRPPVPRPKSSGGRSILDADYERLKDAYVMHTHGGGLTEADLMFLAISLRKTPARAREILAIQSLELTR